MQLGNSRFFSAAIIGAKAGAKTAWWISRMMFFITFFITVLKWSGILAVISEWLEPILRHVGLNTEGALVFITGALANIYSAIAVMTTLDVGMRMGTIIAVMTLICHNIIIETTVQKKAGSPIIKIVLIRILTAIFAAYILNLLLPGTMKGDILIHNAPDGNTDFMGYITGWALQMIRLIPTAFLIIITLNVGQALLREYDLVRYISRPLNPLMKCFGLDEDCAFLWVILNILGLAYGSSVMISFTGVIPDRHLRFLNTHAAITHSLLEDTLLFVALGISAFWLIIPRLVLSVIAVWTERLYDFIRTGKYTQ